jgi:hypothetical protein
MATTESLVDRDTALMFVKGLDIRRDDGCTAGLGVTDSTDHQTITWFTRHIGCGLHGPNHAPMGWDAIVRQTNPN